MQGCRAVVCESSYPGFVYSSARAQMLFHDAHIALKGCFVKARHLQHCVVCRVVKSWSARNADMLCANRTMRTSLASWAPHKITMVSLHTSAASPPPSPHSIFAFVKLARITDPSHPPSCKCLDSCYLRSETKTSKTWHVSKIMLTASSVRQVHTCKVIRALVAMP
jgi:hypothetical protein